MTLHEHKKRVLMEVEIAVSYLYMKADLRIYRNKLPILLTVCNSAKIGVYTDTVNINCEYKDRLKLQIK